MQEYVGYLEIPMDDILLSQVQQPTENILDNGLSTGLREMMLSPKLALQISSVTDFRNNVAIPIRRENFITTQYIRMVQFFKYINFGEEQLL